MARPRKDKDPWEDLPSGFQEAMESMSTDEIRKKVTETVMVMIDTKERYKNDPDVQQKKEELENVAGPYKDDLKSLALQLAFSKNVMESRGAGVK